MFILLCSLARAWWGNAIFAPLGVSWNGLQADGWNHLRTQVPIFGWHWLSAEMVAGILTHGFFPWVITFLKVYWFGSKGKCLKKTRQKLYPYQEAASELTVSVFPWSQALPDSKRENTDPLHISTDMSKLHRTKSMEAGIHIIVLTFKKRALLHLKLPNIMMKTGSITTFGKRAKVRQQIVTLYTISHGQEGQGPQSWSLFLRLPILFSSTAEPGGA